MANTYTQIYIHIVFAVSARACVIRPERKEELQKYITGIVRHRKQKLIAINCMPDHSHMLIGIRPDQSVSELVGKSKLAPLITLTNSDGLVVSFRGRRVSERSRFHNRI